MTDLEALDVPRPRPEALATSVVRRLDPWWGWVVAGVLLGLAGFVVGTFVMLWVNPALGIADGTRAAQIAALLCLVLGEAAALTIFGQWRRRRLARKRALIRHGTLATATVVKRKRRVNKGRSDLELAISAGPTLRCAFNVWFGPPPGREMRVLWARDNADLLGFDAAGRMYSGHIKRTRNR
jgi:membrane protein implicated in regulation of membrane protease activity